MLQGQAIGWAGACLIARPVAVRGEAHLHLGWPGAGEGTMPYYPSVPLDPAITISPISPSKEFC